MELLKLFRWTRCLSTVVDGCFGTGSEWNAARGDWMTDFSVSVLKRIFVAAESWFSHGQSQWLGSSGSSDIVLMRPRPWSPSLYKPISFRWCLCHWPHHSPWPASSSKTQLWARPSWGRCRPISASLSYLGKNSPKPLSLGAGSSASLPQVCLTVLWWVKCKATSIAFSVLCSISFGSIFIPLSTRLRRIFLEASVGVPEPKKVGNNCRQTDLTLLQAASSRHRALGEGSQWRVGGAESPSCGPTVRRVCFVCVFAVGRSTCAQSWSS